jgi:hypothetical protein
MDRVLPQPVTAAAARKLRFDETSDSCLLSPDSSGNHRPELRPVCRQKSRRGPEKSRKRKPLISVSPRPLRNVQVHERQCTSVLRPGPKHPRPTRRCVWPSTNKDPTPPSEGDTEIENFTRFHPFHLNCSLPRIRIFFPAHFCSSLRRLLGCKSSRNVVRSV